MMTSTTGITYELQYSTSNGQFQTVRQNNNGVANGNSYCFPLNTINLGASTCGSSISFRVRASACNVGQWSDSVTYTTTVAPGAPSISARQVGSGCNPSATISWNAGSCPTGVSGYKVEINSNGQWRSIPGCGTSNNSGFNSINSCTITPSQITQFGTTNISVRAVNIMANGQVGAISVATQGFAFSAGATAPAVSRPTVNLDA